MVFNNNVSAVVKVGGKILRELRKDGNQIVYLPYGCEYVIGLKNHNTKRVAIKVSIDGNDVLNGKQLALDGNDSYDLEGILQGQVITNRFRFIQKTEKISEHRGDRIDDGLIRIEFRFEAAVVRVSTPYVNPVDWQYYNHPPVYGGVFNSRPLTSNPPPVACNFAADVGTSVLRSAKLSSGCTGQSICDSSPETYLDDAGITVPGSEMHQVLGVTSMGCMEAESHVIVISLRGRAPRGNEIVSPMTTRCKVTCPTCGTVSKFGTKFCRECSTALI